MVIAVIFLVGLFVAGFFTTKHIRQLTGDPRVDIRRAAGAELDDVPAAGVVEKF